MRKKCDQCGKLFAIDELDGKPTLDARLRHITKSQGQLAMLEFAADRGYDFDRLECKTCYGPGYLTHDWR